MKKTLLSLAVMGLLAGCASTPAKVDTAQADAARAAAEKAAADQAAAAAAAEARAHAQAPVAVNPLNDPNSLLAQRSIYFAFNKSNVTSEYTPMLQAHAAYLVSHTSAKVQLQGNTDDRGSAEYNLALGQRRADSVRKSLTLLNVPDAQMSTISYGKEKPVATGNDEAAWAKNRRTDIVYQSE
ncbi:MAG: peptidoglycan-associated lipoprotein Pal [Betaproteobacteria bacterium]|nr:peptidoglycan-associated lipoprotein Pal [Betaproteobacteria bacterium]